MKIIVNDMPSNPKECFFSEKVPSGNYVCNLRGGTTGCTLKKNVSGNTCICLTEKKEVEE